jgi:hypothetical protein
MAHRIILETPKMRITPPTWKSYSLQDIASNAVVNTRRLHVSAHTAKYNTSSTPRPDHHAENPSLPTFNLFKLVREAKPAVRYTVYAGLGLMATVETTFWFHVLRAKFFPRASEAEQEKADALLQRLSEAMKNYHHVWMANYNRYYGAHMWGLGYGGLDDLTDD